MTTPAAADLKPARLRLWSNWLWILAGVLGTASIWSAARAIHDQEARRAALRTIAQDKADEVANLAAARFNLLVAGAFGPMWDNRSRDARQAVSELDRVHAQTASCRCRDTLPITRFFRFDASTVAPFAAETARLTQGSTMAPDAVADSTLLRIAQREFDAGLNSPASVKHVEIIGPNAILTITRPARDAAGTKVYGAVMPVASLAAALFGTTSAFVHMPSPAAEMHARHVAEHRRLVQLDTLGLRVAADSTAIFGALADRPYTATATLPAPLERFHVNISMMSSQIALPLMMPLSPTRLWLNGHLLLATIVVCIFAIGASRREVALARARSDFVAGISHDLRMPLAQILLASETLSLQRDRNEAERSKLTASILREGRRLKAMIDNVLLFSRSGAIGLAPNLQAIEVRHLFEDILDSVSLAVADAGQQLTIASVEADSVLADRALIHQALVNLVDNAMKYGPGGQTIRLYAALRDRNVELSVEDEGPGIPKAARDRLFEPYERLARDSASARTGSGLGLAVTRQIVLACHGSIRIEDAPKGTRIVISLPAA